ncbi:hypothetical protein E2C01_021804 [Portunus trituberculatus]|uniref:Uncharacterized protein n=1 Tax=Portunus trituberculatus TaxID=210409 RepID=A0A5B7E5I9_PORTR|nr:hypothetical protein [Portunus trituberculatus]
MLTSPPPSDAEAYCKRNVKTVLQKLQVQLRKYSHAEEGQLAGPPPWPDLPCPTSLAHGRPGWGAHTPSLAALPYPASLWSYLLMHTLCAGM